MDRSQTSQSRLQTADQLPIRYCTINQQPILNEINLRIDQLNHYTSQLKYMNVNDCMIILKDIAAMLAPSGQSIQVIQFKLKLLGLAGIETLPKILMQQRYKEQFKEQLRYCICGQTYVPPILPVLDQILKRQLENPKQYLKKVKSGKPIGQLPYDMIREQNFTLLHGMLKQTQQQFQQNIERLGNLKKDNAQSFKLISTYIQMEASIITDLGFLLFLLEKTNEMNRGTNKYRQQEVKPGRQYDQMEIQVYSPQRRQGRKPAGHNNGYQNQQYQYDVRRNANMSNKQNPPNKRKL